MRDPRPSFQAWLSGLPFPADALICAAMFFVIVWPLFVWFGLSAWSPQDAILLLVVAALPMGAGTAYQRRKASSGRK
jgi:hypothetical protein